MKRNMMAENWLRGCFAAAVLAGLIGFATGCQDTVNTAENKEKTMVSESIDYRYFSTDSYCRDRLKVLGMHKAVTPGGMLKVQITLRSERYGFWSEFWSWFMGDNPYYINYKFDWMDAEGMRVRTASSVWLTEILMPGETKYITSVAPSEKCKDFFVSFKEAPSR